MKLAIMQPYFFPYLGYFQLIHATDRFILFDDVQYIRRGWINRNRILKPEAGNQYITMSIAEHSRDTLIKNIKINNDGEWKLKIIRQLEHYKKKAPFYSQTMQLITECLENEETNITLFNKHCLEVICDYIGIEHSIEISSNMNFDYSNVNGR
jgi:WbqC-like protein family